MKYVFKLNDAPEDGWKDWYENTKNTPEDRTASFFLHELREWFLKWVFK